MAISTGSIVAPSIAHPSQAPPPSATEPSASRTATPAPTLAKSEVKTAPVTDTVKLSLSAQIHNLKSQGQNAGQIATSLGVDTKTVDTFLNTAANQPPVPAPLPGSASSPLAVSTPATAETPEAPAPAPVPEAHPTTVPIVETVAVK